MTLAGKSVFVTGSSRGIGRAIALAFADAGADVAINCAETSHEARETVEAIRGKGRRAELCIADVASYETLTNAISQSVQAFGRLDIAVANAAYSEREPFVTADLPAFRRTIDVTMWGALHLFRIAANTMIDQGQGGALLAVSSPHAFAPYPGAMAYNMAKAAIDQMTRTAAIELAPHHIRANILHPGWTDTAGERRFSTEAQIKEAEVRLLWKRLAKPEEIARSAVFLCDPENDYISGASLVVDGAQSLLH